MVGVKVLGGAEGWEMEGVEERHGSSVPFFWRDEVTAKVDVGQSGHRVAGLRHKSAITSSRVARNHSLALGFEELYGRKIKFSYCKGPN